MRTYTLYWKNGVRQEINGTDLDDACVRAELTRKSLDGVGFYMEGICKNYNYDAKAKVWKRIK